VVEAPEHTVQVVAMALLIQEVAGEVEIVEVVKT
jgi:hypothetical protein